MKTNATILWIFFISLVCGACTKDEECDPNDERSSCYAGPIGDAALLLTEIKTNGVTTGRYSYDDQGRANIVHSYDKQGGLIMTTTYTYTNGNTPTMVRVETAEGDVIIEQYTLGSDGRPIAMVQTMPTDDDHVPADYKFAYTATTLVETVIARESDPAIYVNTYTFDENRNLRSLEFTLNGEWAGTIEQSNYDSKIAVGYHGNPQAWKYPGANNHQRLTASAAGVGTTTDQIWKYTYNDAGYPISAAIHTPDDVLVETMTYHYEAKRR